MSLLDRLLGPFWEVAGALMPKRPTIKILSGATAVDNAEGEGSTDVTITGDGNATSIMGKALGGIMVALTGRMLSFDSFRDEWVIVRGLQVIQTGTVTASQDIAVDVPCASIADGDIVTLTPKSGVGEGTYTRCCSVRAGVDFSIVDPGATDTGIYNYAVLRPGAALPA